MQSLQNIPPTLGLSPKLYFQWEGDVLIILHQINGNEENIFQWKLSFFHTWVIITLHLPHPIVNHETINEVHLEMCIHLHEDLNVLYENSKLL